MIDVFFCTAVKDSLRTMISSACRVRWNDTGVVPYIVKAPEKTPEEFMLWHRSIAEKTSKTPIYCHADDDCMPLGNRFLERATEIMERHTEYGLIAFRDVFTLGGIDIRKSTMEVYEDHAPGGIYLVRKDIVEFPESHPWFDDVRMAEAIHAKGLKTGRFRNIFFNHYGAFLSTTFPERTGLTQVVDP